MAKGKHATPDDLDFLFDRDYIDESEYAGFWYEYWDATPREREEIIEEFLERASEREERKPPEEQKPIRGVVTKSRRTAEKQAKVIGGRVVRRDRFGRFNSRGKSFQAVKPTKRK